MARNISNDIKYIGVLDTDIDLFESQYVTPNGVTYNSYVIIDEKIAVMDTVDCHKLEPWMQNLTEALNGRTPDYLIVQHMEPDHAAGIAMLVERYPEMAVVASAKALDMMPNFFEGIDIANRSQTVKEGDTLDLGKHKLTFVAAPMVHWPEVIVTYDTTDRVLFSADAFGTFGPADDLSGWNDEARRYYINIVGKYGKQAQALLKKAAALDIATICPLHGPVLTENLADHIALYDTWSSYRPETEGVLIAYASIYGGTKRAALLLADELKQRGVEVVVCDLARQDKSQAVAQAFRMSKLVVAAATYDANIFPPMHNFLHTLQLKGFKSRKVGIIENGSWAPIAAKVMTDMLDKMADLTIVQPTVTIKSRPQAKDLEAIRALADELAK
jgi:flavorubredoxin